MCFQLKDTLLDNYIKFFESPPNNVNSSAFILKDISLIDPDSTQSFPELKSLECKTVTQTSKYGDTYETQECDYTTS